MLQEVIVVEGKSDIAQVRLAIVDLIATEGFVLVNGPSGGYSLCIEKRESLF